MKYFHFADSKVAPLPKLGRVVRERRLPAPPEEEKRPVRTVTQEEWDRLTGKSRPQEEEYERQAVGRLRKASEQGHAEAQYLLGDMYYARGEGAPEDYAEAYLWFNLAATYADASYRYEYVASRDRAAEELTPEQRADAQRRAREFFEATPPD